MSLQEAITLMGVVVVTAGGLLYYLYKSDRL